MTFKTESGTAARTAMMSARTASKSPEIAAPTSITMSISSAPAATASAASCALISERCLPEGNPTTAAVLTASAPADIRDGTHHRRRHAHRVHPEVGRLLDERRHVDLGGLGLEQRVVDQRGDVIPGPARHQNGSSVPPGLQPEPTIVSSSTTGRHGSRFQLVLPGSRELGVRPVAHELLAHAGHVGIGRGRQHLGPRLVALGGVVHLAGGVPPGRGRVDPQAGQVAPVRPRGVIHVRRGWDRVGGGGARAQGAAAALSVMVPIQAASRPLMIRGTELA